MLISFIMLMLGTVVMRVRATDKDDPSSPNGMVTYTLLNATNVFNINHRTGEIRFHPALPLLPVRATQSIGTPYKFE